MNICVYCSSSENLREEFYKTAAELGKCIAKRGHTLVFGGSNKGTMRAVADGVYRNGGDVIGVVPGVFKGRENFVFPNLKQLVWTETMHERKATMEGFADAFVILPGGIGTMDEFFEAFVLNYLNVMDKPIAIYNACGIYDHLIAFLEDMVREKFLPEESFKSIRCLTDAEEILDYLETAAMDRQVV